MAITRGELIEALGALPWGEDGVPAPLDRLLACGGRRRLDGGGRRVAFQLLAALALSGWSARMDLQAAVSALRRTGYTSGAYGRAWRALREAGLYETYESAFGGRPFVIARLTPRGREALMAAGVRVTPSEWDEIERRHRGAEDGKQIAHIAAVCLFLHHARAWGYATEACPALPDQTAGDLNRYEPDALIARGGERWYVEVQRRGGEPSRRVQRWRRQYELQGRVLICATSPGLALALAAEVRQAQVARGSVTDLATLAHGPRRCLWTHRWRDLHGTLEPIAPDEDPGAEGGF